MKISAYVIILVFALFFWTNTAQAQTDDDLEALANKTCECITGKNLDLTQKMQVQTQLGICMLEAAGKLNINMDGWSTDDMRQFGEKVGIRMATKCPSIFQAFANAAEETQTDDVEVHGKIKSVEFDDFATLVFRENEGKEHRLLWITYFNGSDDFVTNPRLLVNKTATVTYQLVDVYMPKSKSYITSKLITKLSVE